VLLLTLGVVLVLSPITRSLCHRMGVPACVGYIAIGLVISALGQDRLAVSPDSSAAFTLLAQLGVVTLLFRVGLKGNTRALIAKLPEASLIWVGDVLTNLAIGYLVARYALQLSLETSLVIATAFSATSVAVSVSVWDEMGKLITDDAQLLVDVAELDDLSGVLLLAILLGIAPALIDGAGVPWSDLGNSTLVLLTKLALFIAGCYLFASYLERSFTQFIRRLGDSSTAFTIAILGAGLAIAAVADYLGFSLAIGALFAGLAFSRDPGAVSDDARFSYFYDFLTPFFFINIGMQTDLVALLQSLNLGLVLLAAAALGKLLGVGLPALNSMHVRGAMNLGISMLPRAEIALVVIFQCRELDERLVSPEVFGAMVVVSLATCIASPILLRRRFQQDEVA